MIICSKKDLKIMTGVMAASLLLGGCSSPAAPASTTSKTINDDPSVKAEINLKDVGDAGEDFGDVPLKTAEDLIKDNYIDLKEDRIIEQLFPINEE